MGRKREFHSLAPFVAAPAKFPQHAASPTKIWLESFLGSEDRERNYKYKEVAYA